jgi:hypothetical protein
MKSNGASERHQNNNLKVVIAYAKFVSGVALAVAFLGVDIKDVVRTHGKNVMSFGSDKENDVKAFLINIKSNIQNAIKAIEYWYSKLILYKSGLANKGGKSIFINGCSHGWLI